MQAEAHKDDNDNGKKYNSLALTRCQTCFEQPGDFLLDIKQLNKLSEKQASFCAWNLPFGFMGVWTFSDVHLEPVWRASRTLVFRKPE